MIVMSIAPLPSPLQHLGGRHFAFYPPIRNIRPNEWLLRRADWAECVVVNAQSGLELDIPREFLGEISHGEDPGMVVSLTRELAWEDGMIVPHDRRVIEFPRVARDSSPDNGETEDGVEDIADIVPAAAGRRAPVISIRLEPKPELKAGKWIGVALVLGAVALTIVSDIARQAQSHQRADFFRGYRGFLQLDPGDDYQRTVRKLGAPVAERTARQGDRVFTSLTYRAPGYYSPRYTVILMGSVLNSDNAARYIGAVDGHGRVLDAIRLPDGSSSDGLLRSLPAF
jgi:hypothetical protein